MKTPNDAQSQLAEEQRRARVRELVRGALQREVTRLEAIEPGLGTRRFYRVRWSAPEAGSAIARVEVPEDPALRPAGIAPEPPLEPIRALLEGAGLPVPARLAHDAEAGIELLEDAGELSLEAVAREGDTPLRRELYAEACSWLPKLQALRADPDEVAAFGRRLDATLIAYKAEQLIEWGLPWAFGHATETADAQVVRAAFAAVAEECEAAPLRLSHRDYKAANLYVRPERPAGRRLVWIDLQGAFLAPPEYDFVALLRDAHLSLPEVEVRRLVDATRPQLPDAPNAESFGRRFTLLTLVLSGKVLGRFIYAARARGDTRYLGFLPTLVEQLRSSSARASSWDRRYAKLAELLDPMTAANVTAVTEAAGARRETGRTQCEQ